MQSEARHRQRTSQRTRKTRAQRVQARRFILSVCLLVLTIVITAVASYVTRVEAVISTPSPTVSHDSPPTTLDPAALLVSATYTAELQGAGSLASSEAPHAFLTLRYDAEAQTITYKLQVTTPLQVPCFAAICQGDPGRSGSTIFTMFPGPAIAGNFSGVLAEGDIDQGDLVGPLKNSRLADLVLLIENGKAYATIGTASRPVDALRGPIR